jgi:hypothetical protein
LDYGWVRPGEKYLVFLERIGPGEYRALHEDAKRPLREIHPDDTLDWASSWVVAAELAGEDWSAKVLTLAQAKRIVEKCTPEDQACTYLTTFIPAAQQFLPRDFYPEHQGLVFFLLDGKIAERWPTQDVYRIRDRKKIK